MPLYDGQELLTNGDFDGDGKAAIAVYRPGSGTWYTLQSGTSTLGTISASTSGGVPNVCQLEPDCLLTSAG